MREPTEFRWPVFLGLLAGVSVVASLTAGSAPTQPARAEDAFLRICHRKILDHQAFSDAEFNRLLSLVELNSRSKAILVVAAIQDKGQRDQAEKFGRWLIADRDETKVAAGIDLLMRLDVPDWRDLIRRHCPTSSEALGSYRERLNWPDHALRPRDLSRRA